MFQTSNVRLIIGLAAALAIGASSAQAGYFSSIVIDGTYGDWAGVPVVDSDPLDNPSSVDIADVQIANDLNNLYIHISYHTARSLGTFVSLDVDSDLVTGFDIFGLGLAGTEAGWHDDFPFTQSPGVFNNGFGMSGDYFGSGAAFMVPYADSMDRELAISLDITFNESGAPVFADRDFTLLIWTDLGSGDVSAAIPYTLAVPEPATVVFLALGAVLALRRR